MYYAELWNEEFEEYDSQCFNDEEECRDWCFAHGITMYENEDGEEFFV